MRHLSGGNCIGDTRLADATGVNAFTQCGYAGGQPRCRRRPLTRVSVVIPTLDEADRLSPLIETLLREPELAEIVVADGGSTDGTPALAAGLGARVIGTERGRGQQLCAGAGVVRGEILLFLHADSTF